VDSANLDFPPGVTLVPDRKIALVTSYNLHKLSAYSYVDANNLELQSSVADSTLMLNAWGVSYDNTRDMAVVHARHGNSLTTIDVSDTSSMTILGSVSSSTYLDGTLTSCLDEAKAIAYTQGADSHFFAAVSYSDQANPVVLGGISGDSTYMAGAFDVACNLDNSIVYVTGSSSNSIAAINVADPSSPSRVGGIIDGTNLNAPIGIVYEASGDLLFVACNVGDALTVLSVADDAASPVVLGSVSSTSYMDVARHVASFPAAGLVFVTGETSDSVCVVDVSDPSTPTVKQGLVDSTYMDGAFGIAWDPAAKLLFATGAVSDSLAVMSVAGTVAKHLAPTPLPTSWTYGKCVVDSIFCYLFVLGRQPGREDQTTDD